MKIYVVDVFGKKDTQHRLFVVAESDKEAIDKLRASSSAHKIQGYDLIDSMDITKPLPITIHYEDGFEEDGYLIG